MNMAVPVNIFHLERARLDLALLFRTFVGGATAAEPTRTEGLHRGSAQERLEVGKDASRLVHGGAKRK